MPVAPSSQQFESTCPGNSSTNVCIAIQPAVGQHQDRVRWNPPDQGNRMVKVLKCPDGYRGQQDEVADTSAGRCLPESGRVSLQSARRQEWNGIDLEASACL